MSSKKLNGNLKISYIPEGSLAQYVPHITLFIAVLILTILFFSPKEKVIIQQENGQIILAQPQPIEQKSKLKKIVGIQELD